MLNTVESIRRYLHIKPLMTQLYNGYAEVIESTSKEDNIVGFITILDLSNHKLLFEIVTLLIILYSSFFLHE